MSRYVNIMAKVSPETAARMDRAVDKLGLKSKYEFVQNAVALVLKYVDPCSEPLNPEEIEQMEALKHLWGNVASVRQELARVKPNGGRHIEPTAVVAIYGKESYMIRATDNVGNYATTTNQREIVEVLLSKLLPSPSLDHLRNLRRMHNATMYSVLLTAIAQADGGVEDNEVEEEFSQLSDGDPRTPRFGIENKPARARNKRKF